MKRRLFLKSSLSSVVAFPALAHGATKDIDAGKADFVFHDERFDASRTIASRLAPFQSLTPVRSDVTALWTGTLNALSRQAPLTLRGVTTESFYFCLMTLLQSQARVDAKAERISRDLYSWSINTALQKKTG